jgi:hypothetical protein
MRFRSFLRPALLALAFALPGFAEEAEKPKETPQEAFEGFRKAGIAGDYDKVWDVFSKATKKALLEQFKPAIEQILKDSAQLADLSKKSGKTVEELKKLTDEAFVKVLMKANANPDTKEIEEIEWVGAEVKDGVAVCSTKTKDGEVSKDVYVLEEGRWKLDMEKTEALKAKEAEEKEKK